MDDTTSLNDGASDTHTIIDHQSNPIDSETQINCQGEQMLISQTQEENLKIRDNRICVGNTADAIEPNEKLDTLDSYNSDSSDTTSLSARTEDTQDIIDNKSNPIEASELPTICQDEQIRINGRRVMGLANTFVGHDERICAGKAAYCNDRFDVMTDSHAQPDLRNTVATKKCRRAAAPMVLKEISSKTKMRNDRGKVDIVIPKSSMTKEKKMKPQKKVAFSI